MIHIQFTTSVFRPDVNKDFLLFFPSFFLHISYTMASNAKIKISNAERLDNAKRYKEEGNDCHKRQDFKHAIGKYHRALLQLKSIGSDQGAGLGALMSSDTMAEMGLTEPATEEVKQETAKLSADCYNNLAACLLKQPEPNYVKILEYCNRVLEFDSQNVKAFYRQGVCLYNLKKYDEALASFEQSERIDSSFSASLITKHKASCKEGIRRDEQKLKETYRGMFQKTSANKEAANG